MSAGWKFEVIQKTLQEDGNRLSVSMLCDIAGVSRSGYYRWLNAADVREKKEKKDREDFELIWLNHKTCGIWDSSHNPFGSYPIALGRNIHHLDNRIPACEEF